VIRARRALLMLAQQPGVMVVAGDATYRGPNRSTATLAAVAGDNRTLTIAGMDDAGLLMGNYIEVQRHFHTVTADAVPDIAGRITVEVMPHVEPSIPIGGKVELTRPGFLAVVDNIRPAVFENVLAGEASFSITQVYQ